MIYFDHAATSFPKPLIVQQATEQALRVYAANPGRSGYAMALSTAEQVYACRERAAVLFGISDPRRVVFLSNCTQALNTAIKSVLRTGGRVTVSDLEHNAVMRPLHTFSGRTTVYDIAHVAVGDEDATVRAFENAVGPQTKAIVCTHASNVLGCVLPIARLSAVAHRRGIPIIVDAAQSAGHIPINMERDGIDCVCAAGHKGLLGPMGTGLLICNDTFEPLPLIEGGTGSDSLSLEQPSFLPDRLESGTLNVPGICGLRAGIDRVLRIGVEHIAEHEMCLCIKLYDALAAMEHVTVCSPRPVAGQSTAVVSFTASTMGVEELCAALASCGVAVRGGLHCAPTAHRAIGTLPEGTVRVSPGVSNTEKEVYTFLQILKKIL